MIEIVNEAFGTCFEEEKIGQIQIKGLPLAITSSRVFYKITDGVDAFAVVEVGSSERFSVSALAKQNELYAGKTRMPAAFMFHELTRPQRDSLVKHRLPFIYEARQIYLPFLGMTLQNRFSRQKEIRIEKMMPVTQSLFLYLLYTCSGRKIMKKQAAEYLKTTGTSITRASSQLAAMGLISQQKQGKEFYMWTEPSGDDLIRRALPYMINPVQDKITVRYSSFFSSFPLSGESAISGENPRQLNLRRCVAVDKDLYREYLSGNDADDIADTAEEVDVELWKYDPRLFSKGNAVDPVSLYLSVCDKSDNKIKLQWRS